MSIPNEKKQYTSKDYYSIPEDKRVELIDGVLYNLATPSTNHQGILQEISFLLTSYIKKNNGNCRVFPAPFSVELSDTTIVEPDISVICDKNKLTQKGCKGAPDFIIEITSTNSRNDYIKKLWLYEKYGVREYWIINPVNQSIFVYFFESEEEPQKFSFDDTVKVNIYDDLSIDFKEIKNILI